MIRLILIIIVLLAGFKLRASTYYVDYVGGSDAANGTSTSTPFKHCPGDSTATGNAASATLAGDDVIIFKGGVSYILAGVGSGFDKGIVMSWSGSSGHRITYDGNTAGTFGTGKAIITDNYGTAGRAAFYSGTLRTDITVKNFIIRGIGGSATPPTDMGSSVPSNTGGGVLFDGGCRRVSILNNDFSELGYYWNVKPMAASSIVGAAIQFQSTVNEDIIIQGNDISKTAIGCEFTIQGSLTNLNISTNVFHNSIVWCIDFAAASVIGSMGATLVTINTFHDYAEFDGTNWTGYGEFPHTDGIFYRSEAPGFRWCTNNDATGISFTRNFFYQTNPPVGGTASIYLTGGPSANISNNLLIRQGKGRFLYFINGSSVSQVVRFNNNTIIDYVTPMEWGESGGGSLPFANTGDLFEMKNNIFVDLSSAGSNGYLLYSASSATNEAINFSWNNNCYYTSNTLGNFVQWTAFFGTGALSALQSKGLEAQGIQANPLLSSISQASDPATLLNGVYSLQSTSPCLNIGQVLTGYLANIDYTGTTRGSAGWDFGAYESITGYTMNLGSASLRGSFIIR